MPPPLTRAERLLVASLRSGTAPTQWCCKSARELYCSCRTPTLAPLRGCGTLRSVHYLRSAPTDFSPIRLPPKVPCVTHYCRGELHTGEQCSPLHKMCGSTTFCVITHAHNVGASIARPCSAPLLLPAALTCLTFFKCFGSVPIGNLRGKRGQG